MEENGASRQISFGCKIPRTWRCSPIKNDYAVGLNMEPISKRPILADLCVGLQILILKIFNIFLRLKFSPASTSAKLKRFETGSMEKKFDKR
jgi:hypothetical protein